MGSDIDRKNCFIFYLQKKKKKKITVMKKSHPSQRTETVSSAGEPDN